MSVKRFTDDASVLGEGSRIALGAEFVQQVRRSLNVGEEERDCSGGQLTHHTRMMRQNHAYVTNSMSGGAATELSGGAAIDQAAACPVATGRRRAKGGHHTGSRRSRHLAHHAGVVRLRAARHAVVEQPPFLVGEVVEEIAPFA